MNNTYTQFYLACYTGDLNLVKDLYKSDTSILESRDRARVYFYNACINSQIDVAKWMASILENTILFDPYLLIDICTISKNQKIAEWVHNTFPVEVAKDNHFTFHAACTNSPEIAQWLMQVYPYKYYIDASGNGYVRDARSERWEKRKCAMMYFYKASPHKDIWRKIIGYI
jgi:hypothetical protein